MFDASALRTGRLAGGSRQVITLLQSLDGPSRASLYRAARGALRRTRGLLCDGRTVVSEIIGARDFVEWEHYPEHDARARRGGLYYYHAHPAARRMAGEHGHFHLFAWNSAGASKAQSRSHTHLCALSVNDRGMPLRVFTTNQWVTAEYWEPAEMVLQLMDGTRFDHIGPTRVGGWLQAVLGLFRPQVERVIHLRDARVRLLQKAGRKDLLSDRRTHILSQCAIDLETQILALEQVGWPVDPPFSTPSP